MADRVTHARFSASTAVFLDHWHLGGDSISVSIASTRDDAISRPPKLDTPGPMATTLVLLRPLALSASLLVAECIPNGIQLQCRLSPAQPCQR